MRKSTGSPSQHAKHADLKLSYQPGGAIVREHHHVFERAFFQVSYCVTCQCYELFMSSLEGLGPVEELGYHDYGPFDGLPDVLDDLEALLEAWETGRREGVLDVWPKIG
jgi:hypothetical protein